MTRYNYMWTNKIMGMNGRMVSNVISTPNRYIIFNFNIIAISKYFSCKPSDTYDVIFSALQNKFLGMTNVFFESIL